MKSGLAMSHMRRKTVRFYRQLPAGAFISNGSPVLCFFTVKQSLHFDDASLVLDPVETETEIVLLSQQITKPGPRGEVGSRGAWCAATADKEMITFPANLRGSEHSLEPIYCVAALLRAANNPYARADRSAK